MARLEHLSRNRHAATISLRLLEDDRLVGEVGVGIELNWVQVRHIVRQQNVRERYNAEGTGVKELWQLAALDVNSVGLEVDSPKVAW